MRVNNCAEPKKSQGKHTICQLLEFIGRGCITCFQGAIDVDRVPLLLRSDERDARSLVPSASRSAGTMDVVLHMIGSVVVYDELQLFDV